MGGGRPRGGSDSHRVVRSVAHACLAGKCAAPVAVPKSPEFAFGFHRPERRVMATPPCSCCIQRDEGRHSSTTSSRGAERRTALRRSWARRLGGIDRGWCRVTDSSRNLDRVHAALYPVGQRVPMTALGIECGGRWNDRSSLPPPEVCATPRHERQRIADHLK